MEKDISYHQMKKLCTDLFITLLCRPHILLSMTEMSTGKQCCLAFRFCTAQHKEAMGEDWLL